MGILREEAIAIARKESEKHGWLWLEPIHVGAKGANWVVHSNYSARGANVLVTVRRDSGEVSLAKYLPR